MTPAVFLDRDGTLIQESGYLDSIERLKFFPFTIDAVRLLNRAGLPVVVISNQSGVARGLFPESFVAEAHASIERRLRLGGACLDGFYYCPHHPDAAVSEYRCRCDCRKPAPGLLRRAAKDLGLDLARSVVVGDRWDDVLTARPVGGRGVLVRTGYGQSLEFAPPDGARADAIVDDLAAAVAWILGKHE
jgi:D-glycero-D-manno-heptose 1,7-bisphosphate phosphatase